MKRKSMTAILAVSLIAAGISPVRAEDEMVSFSEAAEDEVIGWEAEEEVLPVADETLQEEAVTEENTADAETKIRFETEQESEAAELFTDAAVFEDELLKSDEGGYVLMNIPYALFYAAEGTSDVDGFSSATFSKPLNYMLTAGSYHSDPAGSGIDGVTYAVKVDADELEMIRSSQTQITDDSVVSITSTNRGQTTTVDYTGAQALFQAPDFAYYILDQVPDSYKELSIGADGSYSFGPVQAGFMNSLASASISWASNYGDYQITITDAEFASASEVYGVMLTTGDGKCYGLAHMANLWRVTNLAFSTGHTTESHGCPLSYEAFRDMEGKTITQITYYTSEGNYRIPTDLYVAPYMNDAAASFEDPSVICMQGLPADVRDARVSVSYTTGSGREAVTTYLAEDVPLTDGRVRLDTAAEYGVLLTVKITSSNYAVRSIMLTLKPDAGLTADVLSYKVMADAEDFALGVTEEGDGMVTYTSDNEAVAVVSEDGIVSVRGGGTAVITVSSAETENYAGDELKIKVVVQRYGTEIRAESVYNVRLGDKAFKLKAESNSDGTLTYTCDKPGVVKVNKNGKVTITGVGSAKITVAAAKNGMHKAARKVIRIHVAKPEDVSGLQMEKKMNELKISWNKDKAVSGYQVQLSDREDFSKILDTRKTDKASETEASFRLMRAGKDLYVRVRSYVKAPNGRIYYTKWVTVKA